MKKVTTFAETEKSTDNLLNNLGKFNSIGETIKIDFISQG